ncbi:MAG TPA: signal peptide peptidase SppA [Prevotella sp.]|jgi:signal peptide peptidase sppA, 67K type|nr:signal peptide peptidase SppA [Prevotella sp.]
MKDFFKNVLATAVGVLLVGFITGFFMVVSLVGMALSQSETAPVADNSVLVLRLTGSLSERANDDVLASLFGDRIPKLGLATMTEAIRQAKESDKVKGIYIEAGAFAPDSYASLAAIRRELEEFRKAGKWIVAYGDSYTQGAYYLASVADKVYLNPQGQVDWHGLGSEPVFVKDLLAKLNVRMQVAKVGTYKSATEMFTGEKMSDADRQQTTAYLTGIWQNVVSAVGKSRSLTAQQLNAYADSLVSLAAPQDYVRMRMVDGLLYTDQVRQAVKKKMGLSPDDEIPQVSMSDLLAAGPEDKKGDEIAVYYAVGDIVDGVVAMPSRESVIDAQKVCADLQDLAKDKDVKAVVLRVNSPGGSAYASEQIWHQVMELKKVKPVVVSMGSYAASGGYYISCPANWIVAEPNTLTGSIGIFGMFPDVSGLLREKLGLKFDEVKTNKYALFGTRSRPFTADELSHLESYIDRGYKLFRQRVADGRRLKVDQVEQVAQGHVWLGQDALRVGLVDQLGGVEVALRKAAQLAKLTQWHSTAYPVLPDYLSQLLDLPGAARGNYLDEQMRQSLGAYYEPFALIRDLQAQNPVQARLPFEPNIH